MPASNLNPVGLLLAAATAVTNVGADVSRKKVVAGNDLVAATFWVRVFAVVVVAAALAVQMLLHKTVRIHAVGSLFGIAALHAPPQAIFLIYLTIDVLMIGCAQLLLMQALKVSPISQCVPFMAFTPVFLIGTAYVVNHQLPARIKLLGVALIVVGSLAMHRRLFAQGPLGPLRAIMHERGSRYVLIVAVILAVTNPIENLMKEMSDPLTIGFCYCLGLCVLFAVLALARQADLPAVMRKAPQWAILAGCMDAGALVLQFYTYSFLPVVITVSIKRAGIVLSVLAGWLIFREKRITEKLIATMVMLGGVLIIYLPVSPIQAWAMAVGVLVAMFIAFSLHTPEPEPEHENVPAQRGFEVLPPVPAIPPPAPVLPEQP